MFDSIARLLNSVARPATKVFGGGTESRTATGELRWNYRLPTRDDWQKKYDLYRRSLIEPERLKIFARFAQAMRNLPESAWNSGPDWSAALSPAAGLFFVRLDELQVDHPRIALKIAAIAAGNSSPHYVFTKDATRRMCDWLLQCNMPPHERIAVGMSIRETWPEINPPEQLDSALLELFVKGSTDDPEYVAQICRPMWERRGGISAYIVSILEDPAKLLVIGRNLKSIEPTFCKNVFRQYLFSGRIQHCGFAPSEGDLRSVAAEYFELESVLAPSDVVASGDHYFNLSQWAYRDSSWYPEVLECLYAAAQACENPAQAAEWYRAVVMNADCHATVYTKAIEAFGRYAQSYATLPTATDFGLTDFAAFLVKTVEIANDDRVLRGRNIDLPANPGHPIVNVAKDAFWAFVSWASALPSSVVLAILVVAIERSDIELAQTAATRIKDVFEAKARGDAHGAARALGQLSRNDWYSDVAEPRKSLCSEVVRRLMPVLESISPDAAKQARLIGRNPMWDR